MSGNFGDFPIFFGLFVAVVEYQSFSPLIVWLRRTQKHVVSSIRARRIPFERHELVNERVF